MKKELKIGIVVTIVGAILAGGMLISKQSAPPIPTNAGTSVSAADVVKHTSASDCWVIVHGSAYDVTKYIPMHPGGPQIIISLCGGDATNAFDTKGGKGEHSSRAKDQLQTMLVGKVQ